MDDDIVCTLDIGLKKRRCDSHLYSLHTAVITCSTADTDMCNAFISHYGTYILEVKVDIAHPVDDIGDTLYALTEYAVCHL